MAAVGATTRSATANESARTLRVTGKQLNTEPDCPDPGSRVSAHGPRLTAPGLVLCLCLDRFQNVARARQDPFLEDRGIRDWTIERRYSPHRGIQVIEELLGNAGGDLGAETASELIFVRHDDP